MSYQVAIDGPAGAGKSTIARQVAKNKGFIYVDTGAMYRAMALHMIRSNVDIKDAEAIAKASETADISIQYVNGEQIVLLNGENVNGLIRTPQVSAMASVSSANPFEMDSRAFLFLMGFPSRVIVPLRLVAVP